MEKSETIKALKQRISELERENSNLRADNSELWDRILDFEACR